MRHLAALFTLALAAAFTAPGGAPSPRPDRPRLIEIEEDRITIRHLDPGIPVITTSSGIDLGSLVTIRTDFDEEIVHSAEGL
ncbi:MAG: hypothetical protein ABIK09_20685 [Pseudomonadota bacterium]